MSTNPNTMPSTREGIKKGTGMDEIEEMKRGGGDEFSKQIFEEGISEMSFKDDFEDVLKNAISDSNH